MKYASIDSQLFIENRKRFVAQLKPNAIAIFNSNDEMPRSADGHFPFRQNPDLFYLTGIDQENTILILVPDHPIEEMREILLITQSNEIIATWIGHKYTKEEAKKTSGIQTIYWSSQFKDLLPSLMHQFDDCYLNLNEHNRMHTTVVDKDLRFAREMRQNFPLHEYHRAAPIMHELRAVKSDIELELMKRAVSITSNAFDRVLKFVKPEVKEYEIEAEILHEYLRNQATGPAYGSIVASGKDSCILHYHDNNKTCKDGDILLMDFGAEYANYAADLSRTIPVNGRYSERQKAVYNSVLAAVKFAKSILKPGILLREYSKEVGRFVEAELIQLQLLDKKEVANQDPKRPLYKKYMMHGVSHFLGIDVHDVGLAYKPIKAGMVFTCEPGIYIKEEGLGIRIENDLLVTEDGVVDLMDGVPIEVEEIEEIMNA